MSETRSIRDEQEARALAEYLMAAPKPVTVTITSGPRRSLSQNALLHVWFSTIAKHLGDQTEHEVKAFCNLTYGRPIKMRDEPEWARAFGYIFDGLSYAAKLKAIRVLDIPFTRSMSAPQLTEYMDQMQRDYAEQGIILKGLD